MNGCVISIHDCQPTVHQQRGAALLLVLVALILIITVLAGTARIVSTRRMQMGSSQSVRLADEMMLAAEAAILHWLEHRSSTVVLPEGAAEPMVDVLNDQWWVEGTRFSLRITAWDHCGMAPLELTLPGSIIRTVVPHDVLTLVDEVVRSDRSHPGLDQFSTAGSHIRAFPVAMPDEPLTFGIEGGRRGLDGDPRNSERMQAIGALIATHNRSPHRINVNTAPLPLVEAAFLATGRGGIEAIINHRRESKPAPIPPPPRTDPVSRDASVGGIRLVGSSDVWSFRIDAVVDDVQRSWWVVYERFPRPRRGEPLWYCAQRLVITEPRMNRR